MRKRQHLGATATSGAGSANIGVAGAAAINVVNNNVLLIRPETYSQYSRRQHCRRQRQHHRRQ
jgi:TPP-dependent trihydroxycyclohexane-1,2-dione (THcHDO) dehydratase